MSDGVMDKSHDMDKMAADSMTRNILDSIQESVNYIIQDNMWCRDDFHFQKLIWTKKKFQNVHVHCERIQTAWTEE
jgi:hypothetical protein